MVDRNAIAYSSVGLPVCIALVWMFVELPRDMCVFSFVLQGVLLLLQIVQSAPNDGKYNPRKYNKNGKYVHRGEGKGFGWL